MFGAVDARKLAAMPRIASGGPITMSSRYSLAAQVTHAVRGDAVGCTGESEGAKAIADAVSANIIDSLLL